MNPNHDERGRFASGGRGGLTSSQKAAQRTATAGLLAYRDRVKAKGLTKKPKAAPAGFDEAKARAYFRANVAPTLAKIPAARVGNTSPNRSARDWQDSWYKTKGAKTDGLTSFRI